MATGGQNTWTKWSECSGVRDLCESRWTKEPGWLMAIGIGSQANDHGDSKEEKQVYAHSRICIYIYIIICMHIHMHKIDECNEYQSTIKTMKNGTRMVIKALVGDIQPNSMETNLVAPVVRADEHSPTTCNNWVCRDMCCSFWACMLLSCCKCTSWTCFWRNALLDSAITCVPKDVCDVRSKSAKTWGNTWIRKTAVGLHPFHHCGSSICLSVMGSSKHNAVFAMMFAECVHFIYILCRLDLKWIKMI